MFSFLFCSLAISAKAGGILGCKGTIAINYVLEPLGYPDLPTPEIPLISSVLILVGGLLSGRGIERGPFVALMVGWLLIVVGGVFLLLWVLPHIADAVSLL